MPTIAGTPLDAGVTAYPLTATVTTVPGAALPGFPDSWSVVVVDMDGTIHSTLQTAVPTAVRWLHLAPTECDLDCSLDDPGLAQLSNTLSPPREVQVYLNGHLLIWGHAIVRRGSSEGRRFTLTVKDPAWYLQHRYIGSADPPQFLLNPDFEATTTHWTANSGTTFTVPTTQPLVGTHSAKLVAATAGDHYIVQTFVRTSGDIGLAVYATAWVYIDTFTNPATSNRGLYLARQGAVGAGSIMQTVLDATLKRQSWQKFTVVVNMPPNVTETLELRLYAPQGTVYWDAVEATVDESLSFEQQDQATLVSRVAQYAQGVGPFGYLSPEKSDCRLRTNCPVTGVLKTRYYHFGDHAKVYDGGAGLGVLDEFLKAADGLEWRIEYTTTTRTLHTYYPTAGVTWDETFTWIYNQDAPEEGASWGITGWDYGDSLEGAANQVVELNGWGGGASSQVTRDEAGYSNPATLGGLTLELVETAPDTTPLGALQSIADARGAQLENAVITPTLTFEEPRDPVTGEVTTHLIGVLLPGDVIPVNVVDGGLSMQGDYRVAALSLDCSTMKMTGTVNPV